MDADADTSRIDFDPSSESKILLDLEGKPWSKHFLASALSLPPSSILSVSIVSGTDRPQSTSHSAVLKITTPTTTPSLYIKKIAAIDIDKEYPDLRRNLCYARNELTFYQTCATSCDTPTLLHLHNNTSSIGLHDVSDPPGSPPSSFTGVGGVLLLSPVSTDHYFQKSPLTIPEVKLALKTLAKLHVSHWESPTLSSLNLQTYGGSYALPNRNPNELSKVSKNFKKFCESFSPINPSFYTPEILSLGSRLESAASSISSRLLTKGSFNTLIHGDSKAMNIFLPKTTDSPGLLIDFASSGVGIGMSDVSMTFVHAILPEDLREYGEEKLIEDYLGYLKDDGVIYDKEIAIEHFNLGVCDYARFMFGRFWGSATPETFEKKKDNENVALVNRNIEAAEALIKRVDEALTFLKY